MYEGAQALLQILTDAGHEASLVGEWCLAKVHNEHHPENQLTNVSMEVTTSATPFEVMRIFPGADAREMTAQVVYVTFGNDRYMVTTFRRPEMTKDRLVYHAVPTLTEALAHRAFTVDTFTQSMGMPVADAVTAHRDCVYSAVDDVREGVVRAVGNPGDRLREDPVRIVRAFRLMSQLGYTLDGATAAALRQHMRLLTLASAARVGAELRLLITGPNAAAALLAAAEAGLFRTMCANRLTGDQVPILPALRGLRDDDLTRLRALSAAGCTELELWAVLLSPEAVEDNLGVLEDTFTEDELGTVRWVATNLDLPALGAEDVHAGRVALLDAVDGYVRAGGIHLLKRLVNHVNAVYSALHAGAEPVCRRMFFNLCARPYIGSQLKVLGLDMLLLTSHPAGQWIGQVKRRILRKLIDRTDYPPPEVIFKIILPEAMREEGIPVDKTQPRDAVVALDEYPVELPENYAEFN